ncbi:MAG: S-adenosylmethionine:tRNA ribosyltransferase-isomerase [Chitinophagaceae bacterium]|nr:S-adenosylmethionine:tRNA ribosyltransferase-isomerase [Chitinophagaceae bacterium]
MKHPKDLAIADFTYTLPPEKIAQHPLLQRDSSKLLVYQEGKIEETIFSAVAKHLPEKSTLVFNDTKVIHARIIFRNENEANIEVFLLEPLEPFRDLQLAMFQHGECTWRCLVGNAKKWREEILTKKISIGEHSGLLTVKLAGKVADDFLVHFSWTPNEFSFAKILEAAGYVPLPPYIKRVAAGDDEQRYQTLYAFQDGSVAAPTAGLHFSEKIFDELKEQNIHPLFVTLHVGAGTFKPVKAAVMEGHQMHAEQFVVQKEIIEQLLLRKDRPVVAVGTTSCRTLESLYWLGKKIAAGNETLVVDQWEPYETKDDALITIHDGDHSPFTIHHSLNAILKYLEKKKLNQLTAETRLIIAPGYKFKIVNGLITNFHLPGSTLLLLIAAFIGSDWRKVYDYALEHDFRFLSYGDGSLLWRKNAIY